MSVEDIKQAMMMSKLAEDGAPEHVEIPQAMRMGNDENTKALSAYFKSKDGLAQNAKKELSKYFDTNDLKYSLREQSLTEKVAHIIAKTTK